MRIFTRVTAPFRFGGTHSTMVTEAGEPEARLACAGVELGLFRNPNTGWWHAAEASTGALVGHALTLGECVEEVVGDLRRADPEVVAKQLAEARAMLADDPEEVAPEHFWSRFKS